MPLQHFTENGFAVLENIYTEAEVAQLLTLIEQVDTSRDTFRKSKDLFAIRQFLKEIPETHSLIFNQNLKTLIQNWFGNDYFVVKSIYFDKPQNSNWYVVWHQDLTISVDRKAETVHFHGWTTKQNQFSVQPPLEILENIFTIRIHLDDTDSENGALKVVPASHLNGICLADEIEKQKINETICDVPKGGVMLMKPLLLHSSGKTQNSSQRRVIHIEFSNKILPAPVEWAEKNSF
jgi:ectoine hydroxylase-related dioxygenase (phytanoyl-CoA dioxygenase family)